MARAPSTTLLRRLFPAIAGQDESAAAILPPLRPRGPDQGPRFAEVGAFLASLAGMRQKGHGCVRDAGRVIPVRKSLLEQSAMSEICHV